MSLLQDVNQRLQTEYTNSGSFEQKSNKFSLGLHQYPLDLGSSELAHHVEFNIYVRGKSQYDKDKIVSEVKLDPDSAQLTPDQLATSTVTGATVAAGVIGYGLSKSFLNKVVKSGSSNNIAKEVGKAAATTAVAGAAGLATAAIGGAVSSAVLNANQMLKPDTKYKISDVIALYVDGPPTVKYSMNYSNKDLGTLAGLAAGGVSGVASIANPMSEQAAAVATAFAQLPGAIGATDVKSVIGAASKTALNPFKEVLFESVDFRSFNFKYKFLPRSKAESDRVADIIKLFKFHMHPELSKDKLFFVYPSEFQISYYYQNKQNQYFHKLKPCALEAMDVSYGGEQFSSFHDGQPTEVNLTLSFRELEILTKSSIKDGGY